MANEPKKPTTEEIKKSIQNFSALSAKIMEKNKEFLEKKGLIPNQTGLISPNAGCDGCGN